ncbi:hypothetical protein AAY473_012504 [Plecturocebus cupreus]
MRSDLLKVCGTSPNALTLAPASLSAMSKSSLRPPQKPMLPPPGFKQFSCLSLPIEMGFNHFGQAGLERLTSEIKYSLQLGSQDVQRLPGSGAAGPDTLYRKHGTNTCSASGESLRKLTIMAEGEAGTGTSHGESRGKWVEGWCHCLVLPANLMSPR